MGKSGMNHAPKGEHRPVCIGDSCLCWSFGEDISTATSARVLRLYKSLKKLRAAGTLDVLDIVPSYNAVALYFEPAGAAISRITNCVGELLEKKSDADGEASERLGKEVTLPVRYDGEDIERVAAHNNLSREEVITFHVAGAYTVATIGFLPHFPYLIGLHEKLHTPRLEKPRIRIPAGSVAIGGMQTGVYPSESPGGWNIIGSTDPELLTPIEPGDTVVFKKL